MVFSNLFFVYTFLPLCLVFYLGMNSIQAKNRVLLVFSLIFYAWTSPKYLILLLAMTFINYVGGLVVEENRDKPLAKAAMVGAVALSLVLLGIFKYTGFLSGIAQGIIGWPKEIPEIVLPIGISFYTFQLLSYTVDVYRGDAKGSKSFTTVLLYAALYYQCIAGPIVRYKDVADEIAHREVRGSDIASGIDRFVVGLAKKAVLANGCGQLVDQLIPASAEQLAAAPAVALWTGMFFYGLQIFLDFSAYSDMAIGMGRMVGFHFLENFDFPYISRSITEFWRRWHMSLGTFFRDYVYIPLGGNRKGFARQIVNLFVVWFLTGMWHGASWNFILWGLYFFVFLVLEKQFLLKKLKHLPGVSNLYTLLVVYFGWVLFRCTDMTQIGILLKGMFLLNGNGWSDFATNTLLANRLFFVLACVLACIPWVKPTHEVLLWYARRSKVAFWLVTALEIIMPIALLLLATMTLVGDSYNPFLYFQF